MGRWSGVLDSACSKKKRRGNLIAWKARARMWCDVSLFCDSVRACGGDSEWRQEQVFWLLTLRTNRANSWGDCVSAHVELESCLVRNNRAWILHSPDVVIVHLDTYAHDTFLAWNKAFWQTFNLSRVRWMKIGEEVCKGWNSMKIYVRSLSRICLS